MKKILSLAAVLGGLVLAMSLTACHSDDDNGTKVIVINPTSPINTLVIKANVSAKFTLSNGTAKTGTEVTFNPTKDGTVTITADGRVSKTIKYSFKDTEYQEFNVVLEEMSPEVSQAAAEAGTQTVSNEGRNRIETGVEAQLAFNGQKNKNTTVKSPYSITIYTPTTVETDIEEVDKKEVEIEEPVVAIDCQPTGATFTDPITVRLNVPGSKDLEITASYEGTEEEPKSLVRDGDIITLGIDHFSTWEISLKATASKVSETEREITFSGDASKGSIDYNFDFGYDTNINNAFIHKYLNKVVNIKKTNVKKTMDFEKVKGTVTLKLKQKVINYSFKSGETTFTATDFGDITHELSVETDEDIKVHTGGGK